MVVTKKTKKSYRWHSCPSGQSGKRDNRRPAGPRWHTFESLRTGQAGRFLATEREHNAHKHIKNVTLCVENVETQQEVRTRNRGGRPCNNFTLSCTLHGRLAEITDDRCGVCCMTLRLLYQYTVVNNTHIRLP